MIGLAIFTAIAGCACIFLIYALAAFWREWRTSRRRRDARVVGLHPGRRLNQAQGKLVVMRRTDLIQRAERSTAGRR